MWLNTSTMEVEARRILAHNSGNPRSQGFVPQNNMCGWLLREIRTPRPDLRLSPVHTHANTPPKKIWDLTASFCIIFSFCHSCLNNLPSSECYHFISVNTFIYPRTQQTFFDKEQTVTTKGSVVLRSPLHFLNSDLLSESSY